MNTTIQVNIETKNVLERVKETYHVKSYDDAIRKLINTKTQSLYGSLATKKNMQMKDILAGLRDKNDRD
ncbi:MAG: hypothetical protein V1875_02195 [Candidatus Altiarchaeota archaeon]